MSEPTILTVILNYRTAELAVRAAEGALREMDGLAGEIVVVDNDSQDGSYEYLQKAAVEKGWDVGGRIRVQSTGHNGGFGSGNNFAIRAGLSSGEKPDYVYLLNPDAVSEENSIRSLVEFMDARPKVGVVGSLILDDDGEPAYGAFRFPTIVGEFEDAARTVVLSRFLPGAHSPTPFALETAEVDWVSGASVILRQAMLDEIGLFDETYFLYYEETDLCLRAKRAGWEIWSLPDSRVTHVGGVATGIDHWDRVPKYWFDSRLYYFRKNHGLVYTVAVTASLLVGEVVWSLRRLLNPKAERYRNTHRFGRDLLRHHLRFLFTRRAAPTGAAS